MILLEKLKTTNLFTKTEQQVVDYLLLNKDQIYNITIGSLAKKTYSSNASIIRICKKLGFSGFKDFKIALLLELESQKYITNSIDYSFPFSLSEPTDVIVNNLSSLYKDSIDIIISQFDIKAIENIAKCIIEAKRVFIFAYGDTRITAMNFINKLIKINIFPILATDNREEFYICKNMTKHDCAFFISYSAEFNNYKHCVEILNNNNVPIVTISATENSPLIKRSNYSFIIPDCEHEDKIATFYSQLAFQFILNILFSLSYKKNLSK